MTIFEQVPCKWTPLWMLAVFFDNFNEVKVRWEISWLRAWVSCISRQIQMLSNPQSILSTETETLRHGLEQFDCVDTNWSFFLRSLLFHICNYGCLDWLHAVVDRLNYLIIINFATKPFQGCHFTRFRFDLQLNFPIRLWNEFFDFFSLIYTETKSGSLAGTIWYSFVFATLVFD